MAKRSKQILKEYFASGALPTGAQFAELIDSFAEALTPAKLTIVSGAVTRTQRQHKIETESGAASDDLDTINGGADGEELILRLFDATHAVTVKNGTGNVVIPSDALLDSASKSLHLWYNGDTAKWNEISRNV